MYSGEKRKNHLNWIDVRLCVSDSLNILFWNCVSLLFIVGQVLPVLSPSRVPEVVGGLPSSRVPEAAAVSRAQNQSWTSISQLR